MPRNLKPGAGSAAEIENGGAGLYQPVLFLNLKQLFLGREGIKGQNLTWVDEGSEQGGREETLKAERAT